MFARMRSLAGSSGIIWIVAICIIVAIGCAGPTSPLLNLRFAGTLAGLGVGGGSQPTSNPTTGTTLRRSCDLDVARRGINFLLLNQAQQTVRYTLIFVVSAGPGGFVCTEDENRYLAAGYRDTVLDAGNGATFGCDIVRLLGGTRILSLRVANTMAQDVGGTVENQTVAQVPLNGNTFIPLPELIVLGDSDPIFTCTGNNLCTQRGFVYADIAGTPIAFVNASRTQDTVCNANAGSAPEWRLADINRADNTANPFQYVSGGTIVVRVLDRATNVNQSANQVVWNVFNINGDVIHAERP